MALGEVKLDGQERENCAQRKINEYECISEDLINTHNISVGGYIESFSHFGTFAGMWCILGLLNKGH